MRPIILKGHERSITQLKYNRHGDLLFSCAKDNKATLWYRSYNFITSYRYGDPSYNRCGERIASADQSSKIWNVETGECLYSFKYDTVARYTSFAHFEGMFANVLDKTLERESAILIYNLSSDISKQSDVPIRTLYGHEGKINQLLWGINNQSIISVSEDSTIKVWDTESATLVNTIREHVGPIKSIQFSHDYTMFITASSDKTAKLFDTKSQNLIKTYESNRSLNSAIISPSNNYVILGGGQAAINAATTKAEAGRFEALFYSIIHQELLGSVKGHFGPINSLVFHPESKGFCSGSEDGYIRVHPFNDSLVNNLNAISI